MTTRHSDGFITSSDGLQLYHQSWTPSDDAPAAVVMLIHGLGEHSGRYTHVAEALVGARCAVWAVDLRGHGRSEGKRAYVKKYDEFMDDLVQFRTRIEEAQPDVPLIVLGHSMGGNLATGHVLDHQTGVAGLALSGAALKVGDSLSPTAIRVFKLISGIAPGLRPQSLASDAISRDPAVVEAYRNDPLVYTGKISAGVGGALMHAMDRFPARYPELTVPLLIMHGTEDTLAEIDGSKELEAAAVNADVTAHYYDGLFHEIFNEPEQERVLADLASWVTTVVGQ